MDKPLVDLAAERAVLAGIINHGSEGYDEIVDYINEHAFEDELNQIIFKCCQHSLKDKTNGKIDLSSILSAATSLGYSSVLSKPEEKRYLRAVMNFPILQSNLRTMASKVMKLSIGRELKRTMIEAGKSFDSITGDEPIDFILGLAEGPVFDTTTKLAGTRSNNPETMGLGLREYIDYLANNPCEMVGISTGYRIFDKSIGGGLRPGTVNLVGARPKIGKTSFGDNAGVFIAGTTGLPVLNLDTEMVKNDHRVRILANLSEVWIDDIETGMFGKNKAKAEKVYSAVEKLEKMPYYYESVAGRPFEEILAIARRWIHRAIGPNEAGRAKPCVIIYDYLKLMDTEGLNAKNLQEYQLLGFQISSLHNFMVRYSVPCLSFIQLNRDGITKEDTDVVSGSDRQVWLCSNFSIFKKKSDDEIAEVPTGNRKLVPIVTRHGGGLDDNDYINMDFKRQINKLLECKTLSQYKQDKNKQSEGFVVNDQQPDEEIPFK